MMGRAVAVPPFFNLLSVTFYFAPIFGDEDGMMQSYSYDTATINCQLSVEAVTWSKIVHREERQTIYPIDFVW